MLAHVVATSIKWLYRCCVWSHEFTALTWPTPNWSLLARARPPVFVQAEPMQSFLEAAEQRISDAQRRAPPRLEKAAIVAQLEGLLLRPAAEQNRTWRLEVTPSTLPGAGDGVFVRGACPAGTVVAVYPCVSYAQEDLPTMHKIVLPGNDYVLMRRDGVLLDGRPDGTSAQLFAVAEQRDRAAGLPPLVKGGEHSVGNKINHPAGGTPANVYVHPFDLLRSEHVALHPHLPVVCFRPPAEGEPCKCTAVLVTSRAVRDEELFLNYKYQQTDNAVRQRGADCNWYSPVG